MRGIGMWDSSSISTLFSGFSSSRSSNAASSFIANMDMTTYSGIRVAAISNFSSHIMEITLIQRPSLLSHHLFLHLRIQRRHLRPLSRSQRTW